MLRQNSRLMSYLHRSLDLLLTSVAFWTAYFIARDFPSGGPGVFENVSYQSLFLLVLIIWYAVFKMFKVYSSHRYRSLKDICVKLLKAIFISILVFSLCLFALNIQPMSRVMVTIFLLLDILFLCASKSFVYRTLRYVRKDGHNIRNVLVVGSKTRARNAIKVINGNVEIGLRIVGCLETDGKLVGSSVVDGLRVIDTLDQLDRILRGNVIDELIIAMPVGKIQMAEKYLAIAESMGVKVRILSGWQIQDLKYDPRIAQIKFEMFLGIPALTLHANPANDLGLFLKSIFDYITAGLILALTLPLFGCIAFLILASSKGPVFYIQKRCGLRGRVFRLYKFRTMVEGADRMNGELENLNEMDGPVFKMKKDPRIIPYLGTFLRKTGLDELPQLINVLKGEMSIVGPRPPLPEEVEQYEIGHLRRLSMKPGLTCVWQVTPRRNHLRFVEWIKMDLEYIDNWSFFLDIKIMLLTFRAVILGSGY